MIINYVLCQTLLVSNKQASEFTVHSFLLVPINSEWVTGLSKIAPSPEQKSQMLHFWASHKFFNAYNARRKFSLWVFLQGLSQIIWSCVLIGLENPPGLSLALSLCILSTPCMNRWATWDHEENHSGFTGHIYHQIHFLKKFKFKEKMFK